MKPELHKYQRRAINWLKSRDYGYLAIDMGLGKTRCIIEYLRETGRSALVIAPLQVALTTWPAELKKWAPEITYQILHGRDKDVAVKTTAQVYIINFDGMRWLATTGKKWHGYDLIIDEATGVKSRSTQRTKTVISMRKNFAHCFLMSGTPAPQGIWDWWSQMRIMDEGKCLGVHWGPFQQRFLRVNPWTHAIDVVPGAEQAVGQLIGSNVLRMEADDYLELPPFVQNDIMLDLPGRLRQQYRDLDRKMVLQLDEEAALTVTSATTAGMKLRQFLQGAVYDDMRRVIPIHSLKLDALEAIHESLSGVPNLVPIAFKFELQAIQQRFGKVPVLAGGVDASERSRIIAEWNEGKIPMLLVHPAAVSHGVNLQAGGHYITWLALTWSYELYHQLNGRLRRQGQEHPVVLNRVLFKKTKDERIAKVLEDKASNQQAILDALTLEE